MSRKTKTILITGAAGFIGSNLSRKLLEQNYSVIGLDNFLNNYDISIKKKNLSDLKKQPKFQFYPCDILESDKLKHIFDIHQFDIVIHLAARAGIRPSLIAPQEYFKTNVIGTINILEEMKRKQVKQIIFASSSSVYGNNAKVPFRESDNTDSPISPYGASKKSTEIICATYAYLYNIQTTIFRFFSVYGISGRPDMAPYIFTQSIIDGLPISMFGQSIKRDYTYIDDIVRGIIAGIENPFHFEIINLGNNSPISLEYLISTLEKVLNKKAIIEIKEKIAGDVNITFADVSKAKQLLNWEPQVNMEEGLKMFTQWLEKKHK